MAGQSKNEYSTLPTHFLAHKNTHKHTQTHTHAHARTHTNTHTHKHTHQLGSGQGWAGFRRGVDKTPWLDPLSPHKGSIDASPPPRKTWNWNQCGEGEREGVGGGGACGSSMSVRRRGATSTHSGDCGRRAWDAGAVGGGPGNNGRPMAAGEGAAGAPSVSLHPPPPRSLGIGVVERL